MYMYIYIYYFITDLNFLMEELINPEKQLPRIVLSSIITVTVSYLLANIAYFSVLDVDMIKSSKSIGIMYIYIIIYNYIYAYTYI
jgi:amino acid transporter